MRIIFVADIHHAFRPLETLLNSTEADLYLITGDLVYRAFYRYETAWRFMELQQVLKGHEARKSAEETLFQTATHLKETGEGALSAQAAEYLQLCKKAETYLQKSYERLEKIFSAHPDRSIYVLPGNYDMDLRDTGLKARNLHLECLDEGGLRIAGYGGALVQTPGMPDHLQVPFREERRGGDVRSEPLAFFRKAKPHILVLHEAPYGYLDTLPGYGHAGSTGIRSYLDEAVVSVVLSGHYHEHWGALFEKGTCFFNPSNFGRTVEVSQARQGGYFLDMIMEDKAFSVTTLRKLEKGRIDDVLDYRMTDEGPQILILDEKRFSGMGGRVPKVEHIKPIRQLLRIKSFFLEYETPETLDLINKLRGIYRDIQKQGMEVGFDLLGSLNFGMAQEDSDMDLVVYLREKDCVLDDMDACEIPRPLAAVFKALEERRLNIEVCDSLDLDRVKRAIIEEDMEDGQLQRFIFYRAVCRPVNLRFIKEAENLFLEKDNLRKEMEKDLKEYLEILVSSVRHVSSFAKYKTRLHERGIILPPDVEDAMKNYLRG